jgi:hypothetical protein
LHRAEAPKKRSTIPHPPPRTGGLHRAFASGSSWAPRRPRETPKGRLSKLEKHLVTLPWQAVREGVDVKLLPQDQELYVLAQSHARIDKERAMRRRKVKWLWARLKEIAAMDLDREELLMKLGAARTKARMAWRLVDVALAPEGAT